MERPSDEMTAEVVAKWQGVGHPHLIYGWCNKTNEGWFVDPSDEDTDEYADPRDDTNVALDLLAHTLKSNLNYLHESLRDEVPADKFTLYIDCGLHCDNLTLQGGEQFRYDVVHFAYRSIVLTHANHEQYIREHG